MANVRITGVQPGAALGTYSHEVSISAKGKTYGLRLRKGIKGIQEVISSQDVPITKLEQNSWHLGMNAESWVPKQYAFAASMNAWSTTPEKFHATPQFFWAKGLRDADFHMPGNVTWKPLFGTGSPSYRCLAVTFVSSSIGGVSYAAAHGWMLIRKGVKAGAVGAVPGDLTFELRDSTGSVLKTKTVSGTDIPDVVSVYWDFVFSSSQTMTHGNTYSVVIYGASGDTANNCWEVACDTSVAGTAAATPSTTWASWAVTTYSPYYRVTDADTARTFEQFIWDKALYLVSINDDRSTSKLFINGVRGKATSGSTTTLADTGHGTYGATAWPTDRFAGCYLHAIRGTGKGQIVQITSNTGTTFSFSAVTIAFDNTTEYVVYGCDWFVEIGTTGLGTVTGKPAIANGIVYFPQGDSTDIRIMHMDYTDADDHAFDVEETKHNRATFLAEGFDISDGPVLWRANLAATASGSPNGIAVSVGRAPTSPAGVPVPFGTDLTFRISTMTGDNTSMINKIFGHTNKLYVFKEDTLFLVDKDSPVQIKTGLEPSPSIRSGSAVCVGSDTQLYAWLWNDVWIVSSGGVYPTGLNSNRGIPSERSGYVASLAPALGWIFAGMDAESSRTSAIYKYSIDSRTWCENFRALKVGQRIRSVGWQACDGTRPRLWIEMGGEIIYQNFPINGVRPLNDSGLTFQHEWVQETATYDLLSTDPKYIADVIATAAGLAENMNVQAGNKIVVEYQLDTNVGTSNWNDAGAFLLSPKDRIGVQEGSVRKIKFRLRGHSAVAAEPVVLEKFTTILFSRISMRSRWLLTISPKRQTILGDQEHSPKELFEFLKELSNSAEVVDVQSIHPELDGVQAVLYRPQSYWQKLANDDRKELKGSMVIELDELEEVEAT